MLAVFAGLGPSAAYGGGGGGGPSGPPTRVSTYTYGASLIGVQWTNGDATAFTEIAYAASADAFDPGGSPTSFGTVAPGETSYPTGQTQTQYYGVRHVKNDEVTAWVVADA